MKSHIEYNLDLALYSMEERKKGSHKKEECVPEQIEIGQTHPFEKIGHRNYELGSTVTLLEIKQDEVLFIMRAQVEIIECFFLVEENQSYTRGSYTVRELITG
jgi:hypothetical protein